jgi:hypothetical protein
VPDIERDFAARVAKPDVEVGRQDRGAVNWLKRLLRGAGYLTLDPSPRLRRLRAELEGQRQRRHLPPLPESAYPPGAVPLDCSGIPPQAREDNGHDSGEVPGA